MARTDSQSIQAFFARVAEVGEDAERTRCNWTLPIFPLLLILEADGTLAEDAKHLLEALDLR